MHIYYNIPFLKCTEDFLLILLILSAILNL